jgi:hypothetical protein
MAIDNGYLQLYFALSTIVIGEQVLSCRHLSLSSDTQLGMTSLSTMLLQVPADM